MEKVKYLLDKDYGGDLLCDIGRDVHEAIEWGCAALPSDMYGFLKGKIKVLVIWEDVEDD